MFLYGILIKGDFIKITSRISEVGDYIVLERMRATLFDFSWLPALALHDKINTQ